MTHQIAVIGECMVELKAGEDGTLERGFGGDTLNTALYLARLTFQLPVDVHYVTALGEDGLSQQMLTAWQAEGIHTDMVQRLGNKAPGLYMIETDASGERRFTYWRSDAAARYWLEAPGTGQVIERLAGCQTLYLSGISLAILPPASRERLLELLQSLRAGGSRVVFDNNYRPALWEDRDTTRRIYTEVLKQTDLALLTFDDEAALWDDPDPEAAIARSRGFGVGEVVIKRGAEPCLIVTDSGRTEVPAEVVAADKVVDTTAAGDSFSAGYLAARLRGLPPGQAARWGHRLAGTVIQYPGAIIPLDAMPSLS